MKTGLMWYNDIKMDVHYKKFCENLELTLASHEAKTDPDEDLLFRQRRQLRNLIALEAEFRETLIKHAWGNGVYKDFVKHIVVTRKNILAARPFFRERHGTFSRHISKALKERNEKGLYRWRFNWTFIDWVLKSRKWQRGSKILSLAEAIKTQRSEILEQNLPLAISQARMFWNATPPSHLSYMDIVQIQCQGLLLSIDKFTPPTDKNMSEKKSLARYRIFRAVAIGIMRRDRVNAYSETLVHFFPKDRLIRYQANKLLRRQTGDIDHAALSLEVNVRLQDSQIKTTASDVQDLLAAGSVVSGDQPQGVEMDGDTILEAYADKNDLRPDFIVEETESVRQLHSAITELNLIERKLLKLKGIKAL